MPSTNENSWAWLRSCLAAVAVVGLLATGLFVGCCVWATWPLAGPEDLPEIRMSAEPLISAIDRYALATGS